MPRGLPAFPELQYSQTHFYSKVKGETPATCLPRHKPDARPVTPAVITKVSAVTVCVTAAGRVIGSLPPATHSAKTV